MTQDPQSIQAIDSLAANEFTVTLDDEPVSGIFGVSGLVTFRLDVKTTTSMKKLRDPFTIKKMVQRDPHAPFNRWIRDTFAAEADIVRPTRTLVITAVDDGVPIRQWTITKAWLSEVRYSDFDTGSSDMIEETVTIQYEDIEEHWPLLVEPDTQAQLPQGTD